MAIHDPWKQHNVTGAWPLTHSPLCFSSLPIVTQNPRWDIIEPQTESPPARSGHSAAVHDGKIYIFGGADADYFYNDIWCFDTRALTWTPIPASGYLPTGRHGHSCTLVDGVLYIFGGNSPDGTELNDAYAFKIHGMSSGLIAFEIGFRK